MHLLLSTDPEGLVGGFLPCKQNFTYPTGYRQSFLPVTFAAKQLQMQMLREGSKAIRAPSWAWEPKTYSIKQYHPSQPK